MAPIELVKEVARGPCWPMSHALGRSPVCRSYCEVDCRGTLLGQRGDERRQVSLGLGFDHRRIVGSAFRLFRSAQGLPKLSGLWCQAALRPPRELGRRWARVARIPAKEMRATACPDTSG